MNEVMLAALAIVATCVGALIWLVKFILTEFRASLDKNTTAHEKIAEAMQLNTESTSEILTFMKKLNGRLPEITAEKMEKAKEEAGG